MRTATNLKQVSNAKVLVERSCNDQEALIHSRNNTTADLEEKVLILGEGKSQSDTDIAACIQSEADINTRIESTQSEAEDTIDSVTGHNSALLKAQSDAVVQESNLRAAASPERAEVIQLRDQLAISRTQIADTEARLRL